MSKLETNTIDTVSGSTTLTLGGTNATTIAQDSATTITGLKSTGIDDNATSTAMTIDSNENVGINTTSPDHKVTITGTSNQGTLGLYSSGTSNELRFENDGSQNWVISNQTQGLRFKTAGSESMRIDSSGKITMDTTTVQNNATLTVFGNGVGQIACEASAVTNGFTAIFFRNPNGTQGTIATNPTSVSYNTSSDYRLKENVVEITNATDRLKQLQPKRFNFIADADTTVDGFIAHEVSDIVPEAISGEKDAMKTEEYEVTPAVLDDDGNVITEAVMGTREVPDYQGIDQSKLVPLLVKTIQELEARITELENA